MSTLEARTGVTAPPSGNSSVAGLGEAFTINLNTGQGAYAYKLALPEGRAGHGAQLALEYAQGAGFGPFGLGWRLGLRAITRRLDFGLPGDHVAERWLDGGQELVETPDGRYAAARESAFTRYRRSGEGWLIEERNGIVHECGLSPATRVADPDHPDRVQEWLVERSLDTSGNAVEYVYEQDRGTAYAAVVRWAAYELRLAYDVRPDARQDARSGFLRTLARRCARIELFVDPGTPAAQRVRSWTFSYTQDPVCGVSLLVAIAQTAHGAAVDGSQDVARAPVRLGYSSFDPGAAHVRFMETPAGGAEPPPLDAADTALVTLDRAPLPGILQVTNGVQTYWPNRGGARWGPVHVVAETPTITSFGDSGVLFLDADGSATADLLVAGVQPLHGYYENGGDGGWRRFVGYPPGHAAAPPWSSGQVRLMDVDGDGIIDAIASGSRAFTVWRNGGADGWSEPMIRPTQDESGPAGIDFADPLVHLADMNGDGLVDLVHVTSGRVEYWPGLGDGRFGARVVMAASPPLPGLTADPESVVFADVDGDGCADLIRLVGDVVEVAINRSGREFAASVRIAPVPRPLAGTLRAVNMNGGAGTGLLWCSLRFGRPAYVQLEFATGTPPYLLTSVDNGAGLRSEMTYRPAVEDYLRDVEDGLPWTTSLPFPVTVVAGTREVDAVSEQETVVGFSYHEGHFSPTTRQFQGFRRTERLERGDESRPDTLTVSHFLMDQERVPGHGPEHVELNGRLARAETFALDGTPDEALPYRVEECDYALELLPTLADHERWRAFVTVTRHRTEDLERSDDVRGEERTYEYDPHGNVVRATTRGYGTRAGVPQGEQVLVTEIAYATCPARHLVDRPARVVERDGDGAILREQRRYYDGPDFVGLALGQADRGLLVRHEHLVLSERDFAAHYGAMTAAELGYHVGPDADGVSSVLADPQRCAYDARGLEVARRDALGHEEAYEYDPDGLFRTIVRDSLGETRSVYDRRVGHPTSIQSADGSVASFGYDAQGRILVSLLPGDDPAAPPRSFSYDDASLPNARVAWFRSSPEPGDTTAAVTYVDGLGRDVQQRVEAGAGRVLVSALNLRNPWGQVRREYAPTEGTSLVFARPDTDGRPLRAMRYDARGRPVETIDYGGGTSRATYRPFEVVLQDAGRFDTPRREEFDVLRRRTRVVQELGDGATASTSYDVSATADLLAVHDDSGMLGTYVYDRAGRRLVADHREGGHRTLFYDARGTRIASMDANRNELRAEFDAHGRLVRLRLAGTTVEEFGYDDPGRNALGRLSSASYPGGRQDFAYDTAGRLLRREYAFDDAGAGTLSYEYDALGRELAITHTDGRRISRELSPNGQVRSIEGIVDEIAYDVRGLPTTLRYANGVVTEIAYTDGPGRVRSQRTTGPAGQVLHDVIYDRDALGLLTRRIDDTPGGVGARRFSYDPLEQLLAEYRGGTPELAYGYDRHFNLADFGDSGAALLHTDPERAYRLTGFTPAAGSPQTVDHDANGNVRSKGAHRFTYDYKQALTRFEDGAGLVAQYAYDPFGVRVSKVVDDGRGGVSRTVMLGNDAEVRDGNPTLFVRLGGLRIAVLSATSTRYLHPDPLGTTALVTDESGAVASRFDYRPFGNVAASSGEIDQRCFGSHPFDAESGLYCMQRRHYDPETAGFLQPDPVAILRPERYLTIPRAFHPYAYVGNDPLNNVDPDGLSFWSVFGAVTGALLGPIGLDLTVLSVAYFVAGKAEHSDLGSFARGLMTGTNAFLNTLLGGPLGAIGLLSSVDGIAASPAYKAVLGWSSWLMPMSWIATGLGLADFTVNTIAGGVFGQRDNAAHISRIHVDWATGTIVTHGGALAPGGIFPHLSDGVYGYNLGNFVYIRPGMTASMTAYTEGHETGHTLNVAAFGGIFHLIGGIDENVVHGKTTGGDAYAELLAESNSRPPIVSPRFDTGPSAWWMLWA